MNQQVLLSFNAVLMAVYYIINYTEVNEVFYLRGNERNITVF
jgi:hypothetical protein